MATEDAFNQAAEAKRRSDELIWRVHNGTGGGDSASAIQNTGPLRQLEVRCNTSTFVYVNRLVSSHRCSGCCNFGRQA